MVGINSILISLRVFLRLSSDYLRSTLAPLPSGETFGDFESINHFRYPPHTSSSIPIDNFRTALHGAIRPIVITLTCVILFLSFLHTTWILLRIGAHTCVCESYGFTRDFLSWVGSLGSTYLIIKIIRVAVELNGKSYAFCNVLASRMRCLPMPFIQVLVIYIDH